MARKGLRRLRQELTKVNSSKTEKSTAKKAPAKKAEAKKAPAKTKKPSKGSDSSD